MNGVSYDYLSANSNHQKSKALKALQIAKAQEKEKMKQGQSYIKDPNNPRAYILK